MKKTTRLAPIATSALLILSTGAAQAQSTNNQTNQDRLGAIVGTLFGDRLGLSAMDQAWLRAERPLRTGQTQFNSRVDQGVRSGSISSSASTRLRADYDGLVRLETQYAADGRFSANERADLNARYSALIQTLDAGAPGYADTDAVAQGRADFESRINAAVNARRITRTQATQLRTDYQALIQLEARYLADGSISANERADLDTRLDALDARLGDGPATTPPATPRARLTELETSLAAAERLGSVTRADAADIRVEMGDLVRLEAAFGKYTASADERSYLDRRIQDLQARVRR
ncbi:hypothetical protein [Brevundimonas faecalis]|uniref:Uncharacterized protein n=1 Tax=Brevundimonas faecalis TaxID=947378 RepID=A0ABV2RF51_9CAUL